jgi:hypothetical protein
MGFDNGRSMLSNSKPVIQYTKEGTFVKRWESQILASKAMGG